MRFISKLLPASKQKLVISMTGVLALVLFTGLILVEAAKIEVTFIENGKEKTVKTSANTVGELLDQVDVTVGEHDALSHSPNNTLESGMAVDYKQAKQITVTIDGKKATHYTTDDTVGAFLAGVPLRLSAHDDVSHENNDPLEEGIHIKIDKGFEIMIDDGGKEKKAWTTGSTVGNLLKENDIKVGKEDKVKPAKKQKVKKDTAITIVRVAKETDTVEEAIDFSTEKKQDDTLAEGEEKVISKGKKGTVLKKYEVVLENGEEVSRKLISEDIQEKEKKRVVAIGTKQKSKKTADSVQKQTATAESKPQPKERDKPKSKPAVNGQDNKSDSGGQGLTMTATAYSANCNGCSGVTATGINLNANPGMKVVAVDPGVIPLGSKVWVEGYGEAIAGDTGGAINGNRIDLHVPSRSEANAFGYQQVKVKVIN